MSYPTNYDDVVHQLQGAGLLPRLPLETGRIRRCPVAGDRERRGWYSLAEIVRDDGLCLLVGSYGIWHGTDNHAQKIVLDDSQRFSDEQMQALKAKLAEDRRRADGLRRVEAERAAQEASWMWQRLSPTGDCGYLRRKGVAAHGVRFTPQGNLALPLLDAGGRLHGLQIIYADQRKKGRDKDFWPRGLAKKGHFFLLGGSPDELLLVAEGYATAASLHEATGLPVAVAFDAGNLLPVAQALHKRYRRCKLLICGDDDYLSAGNPGRSAANTAALAVGGEWLLPQFAAERPTDRKGPTDFNDLYLAEGLHEVRRQIEARLQQLGWRASRPPAATDPSPAQPDQPQLINDPREMDSRYTLIYGGNGLVFDHKHHMLLDIADLRNACCDKEYVRQWQRSPNRQAAFLHNVGFDPTGKDPDIRCNLWSGWPTTPKPGDCSRLLDLLQYLCGEDPNFVALYQWLLKWLAYPIQHPGAKMMSAVVMHGPQGVGKNLFFEAVRAIYGRYGRIVNQQAIEDKFNDWASGRLFLVADEVVARQELYHVKNLLKCFITGEWIRINPKNQAAHEERNHINMVFLSNENLPVVLESDDRRHCVIWTPAKLEYKFYAEVKAEIDAGGIAALHDYLLQLDLGDFGPHTPPPVTEAKVELIDTSRDSTERFWLAWSRGELDGVPVLPCRSEDLYKLFKSWADRNGYQRYPPSNLMLNRVGRFQGVAKKILRYDAGGSIKQATFIWPPGVEAPPDRKQSEWLGHCAGLFIDGSAQWRRGTAANWAET